VTVYLYQALGLNIYQHNHLYAAPYQSGDLRIRLNESIDYRSELLERPQEFLDSLAAIFMLRFSPIDLRSELDNTRC